MFENEIQFLNESITMKMNLLNAVRAIDVHNLKLTSLIRI